MSHEPSDPAGTPSEARSCLQCGRGLEPGEDVVTTADGPFCRSCFGALKAQIAHAVRAQGEDVPYPQAALGGVLGGLLGAAVWWGFTVITRIAFGLVAVVIGYAVGHGVIRFAGGKRSRGLQLLSAGIAAVAFFYASYLVTRSFILQASVLGPEELPWIPGVDLFVRVLQAGFGLFDLIFLAIVVFQAYRIPAPVHLDLGREG
jgi:hypothetical protein